MKILVTGRSGQLATSLVEQAAGRRGVKVVALGRPELDIVDRSATNRRILEEMPDLVISTAAYTAVDRAEDEPRLAYAMNVTGAETVAAAAAAAEVPIIHLSSDYVFSGDVGVPRCETGETAPHSTYGRTKLEGEYAVARANPRHLIVRTSWVYSPFGSNFLRTMLKLAQSRDEIRVVADQWGNPTSALDLADSLLDLGTRLGEDCYGTYHLTGRGTTNWAGFARHIFDVSRRLGGPHARIIDITTDEFPAKARRPKDSRLCNHKVDAVFGLQRADWHDATQRVVARLLRGGAHG